MYIKEILEILHHVLVALSWVSENLLTSVLNVDCK